MAKRERNKRAARKARQAERERVAAAQTAAGTNKNEESKSFFKKSSSDSRPAKSSKASANVDRSTMWGKIVGYFQDVRSEMRKVTWPTRTELRNYSVAVIIMLIVFGVAIWAVDTLIVGGLVSFTGLRG